MQTTTTINFGKQLSGCDEKEKSYANVNCLCVIPERCVFVYNHLIWIEREENKKMSIHLMKHRVNIEYAK